MEATRTFTAEEWKEHEQFVQMFRAAKQRKQEWQKMMEVVLAEKAEKRWADRFVGEWKDDRSADEIVEEIRSARTANTIDTEQFVQNLSVRGDNPVPGDERGIEALVSEKYDK